LDRTTLSIKLALPTACSKIDSRARMWRGALASRVAMGVRQLLFDAEERLPLPGLEAVDRGVPVFAVQRGRRAGDQAFNPDRSTPSPLPRQGMQSGRLIAECGELRAETTENAPWGVFWPKSKIRRGLVQAGSGGRIRTYDRPINSRMLYH
jgi:hypothetical protein